MLKSCLKLMAGLAISTLSVTPASYTAMQTLADSFLHVKAAVASLKEADQPVFFSSDPSDPSAAAPVEEEAVTYISCFSNDEMAADADESEESQDQKTEAVQPAGDSDTPHHEPSPSVLKVSQRAVGEEEGNFMHVVDTSAIDNGLSAPCVSSFLDMLRSGNKYLRYDCSAGDARDSLSEIVSIYCNLPGTISFYPEDGCLELPDDVSATLKDAVAKADAEFSDYKEYVEAAAYSLDLDTTDEDLVNQINEYTCAHFDYKITNSSIARFVQTKTGQCWHYAKFFADLCNSVGIPAAKIQNTQHAWDEVTVDGITYSFDPTYNDTSNNWTAFSWM